MKGSSSSWWTPPWLRRRAPCGLQVGLATVVLGIKGGKLIFSAFDRNQSVNALAGTLC